MEPKILLIGAIHLAPLRCAFGRQAIVFTTRKASGNKEPSVHPARKRTGRRRTSMGETLRALAPCSGLPSRAWALPRGLDAAPLRAPRRHCVANCPASGANRHLRIENGAIVVQANAHPSPQHRKLVSQYQNLPARPNQ